MNQGTAPTGLSAAKYKTQFSKDNFTSEIEPVLRQKEADRCLML